MYSLNITANSMTSYEVQKSFFVVAEEKKIVHEIPVYVRCVRISHNPHQLNAKECSRVL